MIEKLDELLRNYETEAGMVLSVELVQAMRNVVWVAAAMEDAQQQWGHGNGFWALVEPLSEVVQALDAAIEREVGDA